MQKNKMDKSANLSFLFVIKERMEIIIETIVITKILTLIALTGPITLL